MDDDDVEGCECVECGADDGAHENYCSKFGGGKFGYAITFKREEESDG